MAEFSLNIYGNNDEVLKTYETDKVRWGLFLEAVRLQETEMDGKSIGEQFILINKMIKKVFPGLTDEDLEQADGEDVFNTFNQLISKGNAIKGTTNQETETAKKN